VCAIDRDGAGPDANPVFGAIDDDVLGCARADDTGRYEMHITGSGADAEAGEVYLVTWFCDNADRPFSVVGGGESFADDAERCVRMNVDAANAATRKFLRSREQSLRAGATNDLNWNVSCPNKAGSTTSVAEVVCATAEEEATLTGATNSSRAFNKEFAHVFRSAAEILKTFDSVQPSQANVASTGCGPTDTSARIRCTSPGCVDEINLHVTPAVVAGQTNECSTTAPNNVSTVYNHICIIHGARGEAGTLNPFRPVHEIGHNIHRRWMKDDSDLGQDCGTSTWTSGGDESGATAEGFANFVAIVAWWNGDMTGFEYDGNDAQNSGDAELSGTCKAESVVGEGRVTQFFVDLWDTDSEEAMDLSLTAILRIWSTFDLANESDECGPDGRNVQDFRQGYNALRPTYGWPALSTFDAVRSLNCVHHHSSGEANARCESATTCGNCPDRTNACEGICEGFRKTCLAEAGTPGKPTKAQCLQGFKDCVKKCVAQCP
jgi:hypothetical protein